MDKTLQEYLFKVLQQNNDAKDIDKSTIAVAIDSDIDRHYIEDYDNTDGYDEAKANLYYGNGTGSIEISANPLKSGKHIIPVKITSEELTNFLTNLITFSKS